MEGNMSTIWKTEYGPRRVRHDPPTLAEAIVAAQGLTDDVQGQTEIAAALIGLPEDQVRPEVMKAAAQAKSANTARINTIAFTGRSGAARAVVVERKTPRRTINAPRRFVV